MDLKLFVKTALILAALFEGRAGRAGHESYDGNCDFSFALWNQNNSRILRGDLSVNMQMLTVRWSDPLVCLRTLHAKRLVGIAYIYNEKSFRQTI